MTACDEHIASLLQGQGHDLSSSRRVMTLQWETSVPRRRPEQRTSTMPRTDKAYGARPAPGPNDPLLPPVTREEATRHPAAVVVATGIEIGVKGRHARTCPGYRSRHPHQGVWWTVTWDITLDAVVTDIFLHGVLRTGCFWLSLGYCAVETVRWSKDFSKRCVSVGQVGDFLSCQCGLISAASNNKEDDNDSNNMIILLTCPKS